MVVSKVRGTGMYVAKLEVLIMPNGEILCFGRSVGFVDETVGIKGKTLGDYTTDLEEV